MHPLKVISMLAWFSLLMFQCGLLWPDLGVDYYWVLLLALPLLFNSTEAAGATWWELSEKYLLDTEYKNAKVLWHQAIAPSQLNTAKKPVHNIEDFSGMKISATQEAGIKALEKLGATPVFFPIPEIYTALERGLVDGAIEPWEAVMVCH